MQSDIDPPETVVFLSAFREAWRRTIHDYVDRLINGEHGLQASLYYHLRGLLATNYRIYPEVVVQLGRTGASETAKKKVVVDLLIEANKKIVGAIELKFTPRGKAADDDIRKDLTSLAFLTNRRSEADRVTIEMPRFRGADSDALTLAILPQRKLIFAAYGDKEVLHNFEQCFWHESRRPTSGYWMNKRTFPRNFGIALVKTSSTEEPAASFFGPPFLRLDLSANSAEAYPQVGACS